MIAFANVLPSVEEDPGVVLEFEVPTEEESSMNEIEVQNEEVKSSFVEDYSEVVVKHSTESSLEKIEDVVTEDELVNNTDNKEVELLPPGTENKTEIETNTSVEVEKSSSVESIKEIKEEIPEKEEKTNNSFVLSDWTYTETNSSYTLTAYQGSQTQIYIPGEYNGKQVILKDLKIFPSNMTDLILEEVNGIKVGLQTTNLSESFYNNTTITSLDLNGLDTSKVTDMSRMFYWCSSLISLDLSSFDTSKVTDMSYMFSNCSTLTSLDLRGWDTSNVTDMGYMFRHCQKLTSLNIKHFNTAKVTSMDSMFYYCLNLTSLDLSDWDTSNVTNMAWMFDYCENLISLDLSGWDTSKVTTMNQMFYWCRNLISLDLSSFDTSKVTDMSSMFYYCLNLTSLDISEWDTSNVTKMGGMFGYCSMLTSLDLSSFDTSKVTHMWSMFAGCSSLISLDLSSFDTSNVTDMASMFSECPMLTSLDLSSFDTSKVIFMSYMFYNCSSLTSLNIKNFDTSNVTYMASMFEKCSNLTFLDLSHFNTSNVTTMINMFKISSTSPLLIVTNDEQLKNYNYAADNRVGIQTIFNANGGSFVNGTDELTTNEYIVIDAIENGTCEDYVKAIQSTIETPTNGDKLFSKWIALDASLDGLYNKLTTTYYAKWNTEPVLIVPTEVVINVGDKFNPLDHVAVTDAEDGDVVLTENNIQSNVDINTPGKYEVVYTYTDKDGATVSKTLSVVVNALPVITIPSEVTIYVGDQFNPLDYVKVTDAEDGNITLTKDNIQSNVNVSKPGEYKVVYTYTDSLGGVSTKELTVIVHKKEVIVDKPSNDSVINKPSNNPIVNTPSNGSTTNKPSSGSIGNGSVNQPINSDVVNKPSMDTTTNKPSTEGVVNKPLNNSTASSSSNSSIANKPSSDEPTSNKPIEEESNSSITEDNIGSNTLQKEPQIDFIEKIGSYFMWLLLIILSLFGVKEIKKRIKKD